MKIGVVSDSHKNIEYLDHVLGKCLERGCTTFIHLGDDYDDINSALGMKLLKVPGVYDPEYHSVSIPNRIVKEFGKARFVITHTPESHSNDLPSDLSPEKLALEDHAPFILHGHTHIPRLEEKNGIYWINPGHLQKLDKRGYQASFSILEVVDDEVDIAILDLINNNEMLRKKVSIEGKIT